MFTRPNRVVQDPPFARFFFADTRSAWLWVFVRVYLGWQWLEAGLHKWNPAWLNGGEALKGFWTGAIVIPEEGRPAIAYDWYRNFIAFLLETESYVWFAKLIVYGEILIGIALILGAFVGISAFFGGLLNWNFVMAGAASTNAMLFVLAIMLMLAWKVAGYIGLDYYLLPMLGTPWHDKEAEEDAPGGTVQMGAAT